MSMAAIFVLNDKEIYDVKSNWITLETRVEGHLNTTCTRNSFRYTSTWSAQLIQINMYCFKYRFGGNFKLLVEKSRPHLSTRSFYVIHRSGDGGYLFFCTWVYVSRAHMGSWGSTLPNFNESYLHIKVIVVAFNLITYHVQYFCNECHPRRYLD